MEVLLATSILLGCIIALSELASLGRKHAHSAEKLMNAQLLCEAKLNDILCGAESLTSVSEKPFEDNTQWAYSVDIISSGIPGIVSLVVEVYPSEESEEESNSSIETDSTSDSRPVTCRLVRWVSESLVKSRNVIDSAVPQEENLFGEEN